MSTDEADSLVGKIARVLDEVRDDLCGFDAEEMSSAVLPIVAAEVRKAAKKAWDQCAEEQATWPRPAGDPRALTFVLLANNPYRDEEKR